MSRVLITGSTGAVGSILVKHLISSGFEVLELTRNLEKSKALFGESTNKYEISEDQDKLVKYIKIYNPDIVLHLAAFVTSSDSFEDAMQLISSNIIFTTRLLDALKSTSVKAFINTGTFAEYYKGDNLLKPAYLYAATKTSSRFLTEYYSSVQGFKNITIVPYTIYGTIDRQRKIIDYIYDSLESKNALALSPGEQVLDFIHVNDVVDFYLTVIKNIDKIPSSTIFHLGTGVGHTLKALASIVENITAQKANIKWGGKAYRPSDIMYAVANTDIQTKIFAWSPSLNIYDGVRQYLKLREETPFII
jgi:nucleoside-diphosphate-sugar epimerase